jgi:hypothetical protein
MAAVVSSTVVELPMRVPAPGLSADSTREDKRTTESTEDTEATRRSKYVMYLCVLCVLCG